MYIPMELRWLTRYQTCRGIGAGIAILLGKRGANVVINYVSPGSKDRAAQVAKEIEGAGSKASIVQADVSKMEDIPKLVNAAVALSPNKKIDILVHKYASFHHPRKIASLTTTLQRRTGSRCRPERHDIGILQHSF